MVYKKYEGPRWEQGQRKNKFRGERLQLDGDSSPYVHTGSGAAAGWTLHETEEGRPYYHHPTLGTSWTKPPGFGDGGPAQQIPGLDPRPLAMLSPNSRRQQIKRIMSWQKAQVVIDDGYDGPPMPSDEGTFCEHLVTCNCDWLDWAVILTFFIIVTSGFFMIVGGTSEEGTKSNLFEIGAWVGGVVAFLWCLCLGLPFIAFNTTLGRSRS